MIDSTQWWVTMIPILAFPGNCRTRESEKHEPQWSHRGDADRGDVSARSLKQTKGFPLSFWIGESQETIPQSCEVPESQSPTQVIWQSSMEHRRFDDFPSGWAPGRSPGPIHGFEARDGLAREKARRPWRGSTGYQYLVDGSDLPRLDGKWACNTAMRNSPWISSIWGIYEWIQYRISFYWVNIQRRRDHIPHIIIQKMRMIAAVGNMIWWYVPWFQPTSCQHDYNSGDPQGLPALCCPMAYLSAMPIVCFFTKGGHGSRWKRPSGQFNADDD